MDGGAQWCSGFLSSRKPPSFSLFEAAFSTSLVLNSCVKYSSVELMVRDNLATTNSSKLPIWKTAAPEENGVAQQLTLPGSSGQEEKMPPKTAERKAGRCARPAKG